METLKQEFPTGNSRCFPTGWNGFSYDYLSSFYKSFFLWLNSLLIGNFLCGFLYREAADGSKWYKKTTGSLLVCRHVAPAAALGAYFLTYKTTVTESDRLAG